MTSTSLVSRDGINLAKSFGPAFWGLIFNLIGFGMSLTQAFHYFKSQKDKAFVKFSALAMLILDVASTCLVIQVFYNDVVAHYGGFAQFTGALAPEIGAECVMSTTIAFLAQIYFMIQIYHIKPAGTMGNIVLWAIGALSVIAFVFGIGCAAVMLLNPMTTARYTVYFRATFGGAKGAAAVADILATVAMCKYLSWSKTGIASTENLLSTLSTIFMNRGAIVMVDQVVCFILFFAFQDSQIWFAPHLILTKLYINTFFAILNSRNYLREKHLGTNVSSYMNTKSGHSATQVDKNQSFTNSPMTFAPALATVTKETTIRSDSESDMV
ncbi:hypothetical protein DFH06DRAFT_1187819 [Mycena polygramma]|nr:hypothetical protein DFH06DRAFT_1187819 [Mycena polygramma]